jgi:hypothetical protein
MADAYFTFLSRFGHMGQKSESVQVIMLPLGAQITNITNCWPDSIGLGQGYYNMP